jgi:hypothetical protein
LINHFVFSNPSARKDEKKLHLHAAFSPSAGCAYQRIPYDAEEFFIT